METESEELKKSLKMCQVMHMGEPAMHLSSLRAVPTPRADCKMLAECSASACRLSQRCVQQFGKGEGTEQKPSCCDVVPLMLRAFLLPPQS